MKKIFTFFFCVIISFNLCAQAQKKVIVEDFTGLWCGWCPLGKTAADHLDSLFGNSVINIGMHCYDSLQCSYSIEIDTINYLGFPVMMVDRTRYKNNILQLPFDPWGRSCDSAVYARLATPSPVDVSISRTYNSSSRALSINVTANFLAPASGDLRMNCVLTEDVQTDYAQANYMDGDPSFPVWGSMGNPISFYTQLNTARVGLSTNNWGDAGIIPTSVSSGSTYSKIYSYIIPGGWNPNNMKIVAFVSEWGPDAGTPSGIDTTMISILNANVCPIFSNTGISEAGIKVSADNCYPNPSTGEINIPLTLQQEEKVTIKVYDLFSREIATISEGILTSGNHTLKWDASKMLIPNGMYIYKISTNESSVSRHFIINK